LIKHLTIVAGWLIVMALGTFLRFDDLSKRPFHADEATGAKITASRMESRDYRFDPIHYHGPLLSSLAIPIAKLRGEESWNHLTKLTPRLLTATCGTLLLLVPLLWRKRLGDGTALLAAALLATSPLLAYYSQMFIHETLLVLFGMTAMALLTRSTRFGLAGVFVGLMFATKETFAISILAWAGAAAIIAWEYRREILRVPWSLHWNKHRMQILIFLTTAALTSMLFYTDGFRKPDGAIDAFRTFFVYETVAGHNKPFGYYFQLLVLPEKSGGIWWFGTPVVVLALIAYLSTFRRHSGAARARAIIRFIAYAAMGHFLIYSVIAYKTPWLACLPWAHVCLLAAASIIGFSGRDPWMKAALALLILLSIFTQVRQTRYATGRLASDDRNPFAYVPTSRDIENIGPWLKKLHTIAPDRSLAIIGPDYWPLPWYLRDFKETGYWKSPPDGLEKMPIVLAMPDMQDAVALQLEETHTALPRGLRAGAPMLLFVRNDIWDLWMKGKP
jgi:uncharacterized protein (TIGR03663 family)